MDDKRNDEKEEIRQRMADLEAIRKGAERQQAERKKSADDDSD